MCEETKEMNRREALRGISFARKLWLLVNSDENDIVNWARNGVTIILDTTALEEYLCTPENIFQTRNVHNFLRQLLLYDFKKIGRSGRNSFADECSELHIFRHEFFKRDRPNLLENIARVSSSISSKNGVSVDQWRVLHAPKTKFRSRCGVRADACRQIVTKISHTRLQEARIRLRTLLSFKKVDCLINNKVSSCVDGSGGNVAIELSADLFENAADSASTFKQTDVAGYYGNVRRSAIQKFFGDYLPTYSNDGTTAATPMESENEDIVLEEISSMPTQPETPIIQADMPYPSIPNFHIIPSNDSLNPYSIKIIDNPISNEVDDPIAAESKPSNSMGQFTAIHYAIGESGSPVQPSATFERSNNMLDAFDGNTNDSDSGDFDKLLILRGSDVPYSLENPFMIKSEPFGNEDVQYDDAVIQIDDNDAQNGDPATQNGDVVIKNDDVVIQNDDFVIKNDDVVIQNDDFVIQNDDIVTYSDDWITLIGEPNEFFW